MKQQSLLNLNRQQREAVLYTDGPALIVAGPGSGKTRVLTQKIAYLIGEKGVDPEKILGVTFTNKAAQEMKERIAKIIDQEEGLGDSPFWIGTFHSTCAKILRRDGAAIGIPPSFVIYDESDQKKLIKDLMEKLYLHQERFSPTSVVAAISNAKCELLDHGTYTSYAEGFFHETVAEIYPQYQKALRQAKALDFGDLIAETVRLFREERDILERWQEQFHYILVDEYQDTNRAQYIFVKFLVDKHQNICVVGDMSQAIYSWRGADFRNILRFERDYPQTKIFNLSQNYRSTKTIITAARKLIENNKTHIPLNLWTKNREGKPIVLFAAENELDEAFYLSQTIVAQLNPTSQNGKTSPRFWKDFSVLYRTNAQSRVIEEVFIRQGIPYLLVGGVRFYERKEIKDVLAYLRLLLNFKDVLYRKRVEKIGKRRFQAFQKLLEDEKLLTEVPIKILDAVLEKTGYLQYLDDGTEKGLSRIENVKELRSVATSFDSLSNFLEHVSLVDLNDSIKTIKRPIPPMIGSPHHPQDAVTLMTLHAAKGLEFPVVFITGMEEGLLPHNRSMHTKEELEEERRLAYVGLTRAKEEVHVTYARERLFFGSRSQAVPSRFLSEIGEEHFLYHLPQRGIKDEV